MAAYAGGTAVGDDASTSVVLKIKERLTGVQPAQLQRLAEEMARIKWPDRFKDRQLIAGGRNVEGQTTKGWPDAYSDAGGGCVHAIEATRQKTNWQGHLDADLKKAQDKKNKSLASYFFVGGYPGNEPTAKELAGYRAKFRNLSVLEQDVTILVGHDLAEELARPQYARVRQQLLDLPALPQIFRTLVPGCLSSDSLADFQPSASDFEQGLVWVPPLAGELSAELSEGKAALVRGHGASGKTTFAQCIAHRLEPFPTFYFDLADLGDMAEQQLGSAMRDMVDFGGERVVFVVDNIHLSENRSLGLLNHWKQSVRSSGAGLLLLGREIRSVAGTPLGDLPPRLLQAGEAAVRGVVRRLLARGDHQVPEIPEAVAQEWVETFGGEAGGSQTVDLVAFGAAASRRLKALAQGQMELRVDDAVDVVRERYLAPLSKGERANLIRLATVSAYEVNLPEASLVDDYARFQISRPRLGIVMKQHVGRDERPIYRLAHAALSPLILRAASPRPSIEREMAELAEDDLATGLQLYSRMSRMGQSPERDALQASLSNLLSSPAWIERCPDLQALLYILKTAPYRRLVDRSRLHQQLATSERFSQLYLTERSIFVMNQLHEILTRRGHTSPVDTIAAASQSRIAELAKRLASSSIGEVRTFVDSHPEGGDILRAVVLEEWNREQARLRQPAPSILVGAARRFEALGRADLVKKPVEMIFQSPDARLWTLNQAKSDLGHLSHIVRIGRGLGVDLHEQLLREVATSDWLDAQYCDLKPGKVAGALFSLANYLDSSLWPLLHRPSLSARVRAEIDSRGRWGGPEGLRAFSLLGTSAAIGNPNPTFEAGQWPDDQDVGHMIDLRASHSPPDALGTYEMQLWLGLREMSRQRPDPVIVPAAGRAGFLRRLSMSRPPTEQAQAIRDDMITWVKALKDEAGAPEAP